jgi:hypothetical protein
VLPARVCGACVAANWRLDNKMSVVLTPDKLVTPTNLLRCGVPVRPERQDNKVIR